MSRRITIFQDTNELDDWKERRLVPLDTTSNPSTRSISTGKIISNLNLLSSFLPNEVLNFGQNASRKIHNEVCFMSVKICGMTQYSQQCDRLGIYNPDDFLDSLEEYFEPIIETISSYNGDIIKLLPSEIWSIWKYHKKSNTVLRNLVHSVINCALRIQRIRDNYEMKEGTLIRVKIGISVGPLGMFKIGDDIISQCVFIGKSLFEVREAANISLPGQILLSLSDKVKLVEYFYITEEFTKFIKILGIGPNWKEKTFSIDAPLIEGQFLVSSTSSEETIFNIVPTKRESEVSKKKILDGNVLLKTLPQPLFKCLLLGKPLNYLSKIQALVAMHISIDISPEYLRDNIDFIDVLLKTLCSIIHDRNGFVYQTKIGSLKLQAVFVFENEDQSFEISCREALNNALGAFIAFGKLKEVKKISVAVSSGMCYCGVINNSIKRSYILVSPLFKIASKLLKLYPGKIVCDQKAMLHSKLKEDQFILLEYQPMKYYDPGPVFEYVGNNRSSKIAQEDGFPLLGNEGNIRLMLDAFEKFSTNFKKRRAGKYADDTEISLVIVDGKKGQGKTKLVNEFSRRVKHKLIIHLDIKPAHKQIPYYTVRKLFEVVLNFHKNMSSKEKHSKLKYLLENLNLSEFLCSLNEVFSTNFDISEEFQMSSDNEKVIIIENLLKRLAYECFEAPYIVIIDVGDNVDKLSCDILFELIEARICFFVLTVTRKPSIDLEVEELIKHKRSIQISLEDMSFSHQTALSCQILNVYAVSSALQRFIHKTSEGNPGKIEKILLSMLENYELVLKIVNQLEMKELDLIVPSLRLIQRSANRDKLPVSSENSSSKSLGIVLPLDTSANKCLENSLKRTFGTDDMDKSVNKCDKYPSFSKYDFSNCECEMILCSVYKQMVEHLRALEEYTDMLKSLIRSCEICLMLKKYEAVHLLSTHGLKIIQGQIKNLDTSCLHLTEGKFHTLIGQALLGMYRKEEAYASFCTAMNTLGVPLPSGNLGTFLKLITLRIKKNTNFYNCLLPSELNEPNERTETYRTIANCLSGLFKIHKSEKQWRKAELCAIWSLKDNIRKNADLPQILECIINLMKLAYQHKNISFCKSLEQYGLHVCKKNNQLGRRDLTRVLKFYTMCFLLRIHYGKYQVIFRKKISETYSLIRKLEYHSIECKYLKSKIWYFISTLILWLETGHALESFEEYELFYKESSNEVGKHVSEKRKLTILIWLWYVRNEQWQKSFELFRKIFEYILSGHFNVEKMSLYALYVFEGILLYLAQRSRDRNILFECNLEDEVIQVCKKFESISVPTIYIPRLMHMKSYHELNKSDEKCNAEYLEKALEASYETENILEIGWIEHSKRGWFSNLPDFLKDAWKENCSKKIDYCTFQQKIIYFTLPVPIN
ncbi:hypothetical protein WA026_019111 [Henosepilachna vigintioctopunctata]|uniref:Adenylate cyclase type 10 n=1 Tax=Henosepilachna vigintioctopunctata TaxID=420089 RepID=A0AAW1VIL1_9CUCU